MAIVVEEIGKLYGRRRVVNGVSLAVERGEVVGLLGPNGAGKTTTFHSIVGFVTPDAGRIYLDGTEITHMPMYQRAHHGIGYLAQERSIFRKLTVEQNIRAVLEMRRLERRELERRLDELLGELDLHERAGQQADTLSGGETRRVEIARALAIEPSYILLDEPFVGIDPRTVEDIQAIIASLQQKNLGILITDHNVRETLQITDRAYILVDGRILTEGSARQLTADPNVRRIYLGENFRMD